MWAKRLFYLVAAICIAGGLAFDVCGCKQSADQQTSQAVKQDTPKAAGKEAADKEKTMLPEKEKEAVDMELLKVGQAAPLFSLPDQNGKVINLADFKGQKNVVLMFYPGDNTPGCTKQLCAVRDDYQRFQEAEALVFGINPQGADSHEKFSQKYQFPFPLLVDADKKVVSAYGCQGLVTRRTVYGINKAGVIVFAQRGMPPDADIVSAFEK